MFLLTAILFAVLGGGVQVGERASPLFVTDLTWLPREVGELKGERATVLVFTTLGCPIARRYMPRIVELEQAYRGQGVGFVLVNVGADDDIRAIATDRVERGIGFPVVKDFTGAAAERVGVTRTPEAVVLDGELRLCYRGRIDDQYRLGGVRPGAAREDLRQALDAVLAGRTVAEPIVPADGCLITADVAPGAIDVDWAEDVAPILMRQCVECHQPQGEAPFSLLSYEDAAQRADMIAEVAQQHRMPPWFASDSYGEFPNRRGLEAGERRVLRGWAEAGAPPGDLRQAPPPPALPESEWHIGEPDRIITQLGSTALPADGYVPYQYILLPYVFLHDTWVSAVQIRCDNQPVMHHANLAFVKVGDTYHPDNFITGQVPGGDPMLLDAGTAVLIPKGSVLGLQVHFVTTGRPERGRLSVGIRFPREPVKRRLRHHQITNTRFEIPPYARDHEVRARKEFAADITAVGMFSHMHLRGRDMRFVASIPEQDPETLLLVPNYSFDWQISYRFSGSGRRFPAGTRIDVIAHFDNSIHNPYNPDPGAAVRFGQQTHEEMMYGFFFYVVEGENLDLRIDPSTGRAQSP